MTPAKDVSDAPGRTRRLLHGEQGGQVMPLLAVGVAAVIGICAFSIDVGTWYQAQRSTQAAADAAAEAAAFDLPSNPTQAAADAQTYASKNISGATTTVTTPYNSDSDQIHVKVTKSVPTFFAKIFGISSVTVSSDATASGATGGTLTTGYWIAPMAVSGSCGGSGTAPCVGTYTSGSTTFNYIAYHHLGSCTGSTYSFCFAWLPSTTATKESASGDSSMTSWIKNGYPNPETVPFQAGDYQTTDCSSPCTYTGGNECGHNALPASCAMAAALVGMPGVTHHGQQKPSAAHR